MRVLLALACVVGGLLLLVVWARVKRKFDRPLTLSPGWIAEHAADTTKDRWWSGK